MGTSLVLVHGRAQEAKDSIHLKAEWIAALQTGLRKGGLVLPIEEHEVRFPYYGDTLAALASDKDAGAVPVVVRGPASDGEDRFVAAVVEELRVQAGVTHEEIRALMGQTAIDRGVLDWRWVQQTLRAIDMRLSFAGGALMSVLARDVSRYLFDAGVRERLENEILSVIGRNQRAVVVAHSMGSVIAYNLMRRVGTERNWDVPLFLTLGSPLAVSKVAQCLAPTTFPGCVSSWINARDVRDVVALHPLEEPFFNAGHEIVNINTVQNQTSNHHGVAGYLSDCEVAKEIYDSLC